METRHRNEVFFHRSWTSSQPPAKILIIRFHAFGDVVITLPYLQALKNALPQTAMHILTREECADIPRHAPLFASVHAVDDRRNHQRMIAQCLSLIPALRRERFDIVLDLQRNSLSRLIRRMLSPKSFSEFDRFSRQSAGSRVRNTIDALHLADIPAAPPAIDLRMEALDSHRWTGAGYLPEERYIILNPAGSAVSKHWPIGNFEQFARLWMASVDRAAKFLIIGTDRVSVHAEFLKQHLGDRVVDLVNMTTPAEALRLVRNARLVLSEDSGLMHMAWTSRIPLVALLGSTPGIWAAPQGETSACFDSSDLACGCCDSPLCRFGDVHCLTRYTPEFVVEAARGLLVRLDTEEGRQLP